MNAAITTALALNEGSTIEQRTVDITTFGARSQEPRRIEIWFHNVDGDVYITGSPGARSWYANLRTNPKFTFHLKHDVQADLDATATPIEDSEQRTAVFRAILEGLDALYAGRDTRPQFPPLDQWIQSSPLVRVAFD